MNYCDKRFIQATTTALDARDQIDVEALLFEAIRCSDNDLRILHDVNHVAYLRVSIGFITPASQHGN